MLVGLVSLDDARQLLASRTTINSNFGSQLERLEHGQGGGVVDVRVVQAREEQRRMWTAKTLRCLDKLAQEEDVRRPWCPSLRHLHEKTRMPCGEITLRVLRAFEPWYPSWPEKGFAEVYAWLRGINPALREIETENGCAAQAFRIGKSPKARKLAASMVADAHLVLGWWVNRWNVERQREADRAKKRGHAA